MAKQLTEVSHHPFGEIQCSGCYKPTKDYAWVVIDTDWSDPLCQDCLEKFNSRQSVEQL